MFKLGSIFVVKYGGSLWTHPTQRFVHGSPHLVFLNFVGIKVVVVHYGASTRTLAEKGIEAKFIDGLRVTDSETIQVVDQVLNGSVNEEVASLSPSSTVKQKEYPVKGSNL